MLARSLACLGALLGPPEAAPVLPDQREEGEDPPGEEAIAGQQQREDFSIALLATRGIDQQAVISALGMRVPELELRTVWSAKDADGHEGTIFMDIHRGRAAGEKIILVDIVLTDGRAFRRQVRASPDDARIIASFVANLLLSIEEAAIEADLEDVAIPKSSADVHLTRVIGKLDGEPEPESKPAPVPEPAAMTTPTPPPPKWLPWELGPRLEGAFNIAGGAPRFANTILGGSVQLGIDLYKDTGLVIESQLRVLSASKDTASLLRVRGAIGFGYEYRSGPFAWVNTLAYTIEGYRIRSNGTFISLLDLEAPALLNGLRLRTAPSARIALKRGPLRALRIGIRGELAGSFGLDNGPRVLAIRSGEAETNGDELFRLGGLELSVGLELGVDFGLRHRAAEH